MPGSVPRALHAWDHEILIVISWEKYYFYPHFADEKNGDPESHSGLLKLTSFANYGAEIFTKAEHGVWIVKASFKETKEGHMDQRVTEITTDFLP